MTVYVRNWPSHKGAVLDGDVSILRGAAGGGGTHDEGRRAGSVLRPHHLQAAGGEQAETPVPVTPQAEPGPLGTRAARRRVRFEDGRTRQAGMHLHEHSRILEYK